MNTEELFAQIVKGGSISLDTNEDLIKWGLIDLRSARYVGQNCEWGLRVQFTIKLKYPICIEVKESSLLKVKYDDGSWETKIVSKNIEPNQDVLLWFRLPWLELYAPEWYGIYSNKRYGSRNII